MTNLNQINKPFQNLLCPSRKLHPEQRKPNSEHVTAEVYNTLGQTIEIFINKEMNAGSHDIEFEGSTLPSGIYYYRIQAGEFNGLKKMVLLK